ncbi:hypothetical protein GOP47_0009144 [Adiantum capillus-veneris]|uniref:EF-hand domain-containing protein n=1 Tax=Adiantum capillus-veneris TaxID=13818 RepID=A0A9D4ZIT5_ADICA|nr:hypothetical protein GOP47_0009144 [Adiantum capillus-veneris]
MKLPLKLSHSRTNSPSSSTPSSPCSSPRTSPTSFQKKFRFPLPSIGSSKRTRREAAAGREPSTAMGSPRTPTSPAVVGNGKGKSSCEYSSAVASPSSAASAAEGGMAEIEQVFAQFDANGDGKISTEELQAVLVSLGDETTREEAALMVREVDADGDGFIDLNEFVEMNRRCVEEEKEVAVEEEMAAAFAIFDLEKKGRITAEGLQQVLQRLGGHVAHSASMEDCRRMIRGVDRKGVGHVDFDDFKRMMTPLIF